MARQQQAQMREQMNNQQQQVQMQLAQAHETGEDVGHHQAPHYMDQEGEPAE
jgi:hypothetical protein